MNEWYMDLCPASQLHYSRFNAFFLFSALVAPPPAALFTALAGGKPPEPRAVFAIPVPPGVILLLESTFESAVLKGAGDVCLSRMPAAFSLEMFDGDEVNGKAWVWGAGDRDLRGPDGVVMDIGRLRVADIGGWVEMVDGIEALIGEEAAVDVVDVVELSAF